jgi:hypothetical protein
MIAQHCWRMSDPLKVVSNMRQRVAFGRYCKAMRDPAMC